MKFFRIDLLRNGFLLLFSLLLHACGVGFGADAGDGERQTELPTQFSEASAAISFDPDNNFILIDLNTLSEDPVRFPRFPCSNITIEQDFLEFELTSQGQILRLQGADLLRKAELDRRISVSGIDSRLFAVWEFPETIRDEVREQITVTITDRKITYRNECRQGV